jgi:hypothetical protein
MANSGIPPWKDDREFSGLDDPEFFEARRHVRQQLGQLPPGHADRDRLTELYEAMTDELTTRAAAAWRRAS